MLLTLLKVFAGGGSSGTHSNPTAIQKSIARAVTGGRDTKLRNKNTAKESAKAFATASQVSSRAYTKAGTRRQNGAGAQRMGRQARLSPKAQKRMNQGG